MPPSTIVTFLRNYVSLKNSIFHSNQKIFLKNSTIKQNQSAHNFYVTNHLNLAMSSGPNLPPLFHTLCSEKTIEKELVPFRSRCHKSLPMTVG